MEINQINNRERKQSIERTVANDAIRTLMRQNKVTEAALADKLGICQGTVSYRLCSGYRWNSDESKQTF